MREREMEREREREIERESLWVGYVNVSVRWQKPSPKGTISDEISPPEITNSRLGANVLSVKPGGGGGGGNLKNCTQKSEEMFL